MNARRGFTLVEVLAVVLILGILAAVVVPRFASATEDARSAAVQAALGGVRSSIAAYRMDALLSGDPPFPTIDDLRTPGVVVQGELPPNPYNGLRTVQDVGSSQAGARGVSNEGAFGWNYFVDNSADPPFAIFYANSSEASTVSDAGGDAMEAREL